MDIHENSFNELIFKITDDNVKNRVKNFYEWAVRRCEKYNQIYKIFSICIIAINAAIPCLALLNGSLVIISLLAASAGAMGSMIYFAGWRDKAKQCRKHVELIKHEMFSYISKISEYEGLSDEDRLTLFTVNAERIIMAEYNEWMEHKQIFNSGNNTIIKK